MEEIREKLYDFSKDNDTSYPISTSAPNHSISSPKKDAYSPTKSKTMRPQAKTTAGLIQKNNPEAIKPALTNSNTRQEIVLSEKKLGKISAKTSTNQSSPKLVPNRTQSSSNITAEMKAKLPISSEKNQLAGFLIFLTFLQAI
jgi:hypothetical protein